MPPEIIHIDSEGHTMACMIRQSLFENGCTFAACTVPHPLDETLRIEMEHPRDCKACLLDALGDMRRELEQYMKVVATKQIHDDMRLAPSEPSSS